MKKKYALCGASGRGLSMYGRPMVATFAEDTEIVGVYDINVKRSEILKSELGGSFPVFTDYDAMMKEAKPDIVIVTTVDRFHHDYIIRSLEYGCDVITEKPMTIDAEKCNLILEAEKRTGRKVTVTFNYRYGPFNTRIKKLIHEGQIGEVLNVHFEWLLDTSHGADYFRRWHRYKENSGGLMVHKSTHHFDLVNWWLNDEPEAVSAFGSRRFYGPTREKRGERCLTCPYKRACEFYYDIEADAFIKKFYLGAEDADGYFRDRCVFDPSINIEDSMNVLVKYQKGAQMSYSLTAHSPYEGYHVAFNGTKGRIEAEDVHGSVGPFVGTPEPQKLRVYNRAGEEITIKAKEAKGGHGGGDIRLLDDLFRGTREDTLGHKAGSRAGAMSISVGIAANESMKTGQTVRIRDLIKL